MRQVCLGGGGEKGEGLVQVQEKIKVQIKGEDEAEIQDLGGTPT